MKHELVELVMHLLWNWMVMCSNLCVCEIRFLFAIFFFIDGKSKERGQLGRLKKPLGNDNWRIIKHHCIKNTFWWL